MQSHRLKRSRKLHVIYVSFIEFDLNVLLKTEASFNWKCVHAYVCCRFIVDAVWHCHNAQFSHFNASKIKRRARRFICRLSSVFTLLLLSRCVTDLTSSRKLSDRLHAFYFHIFHSFALSGRIFFSISFVFI